MTPPAISDTPNRSARRIAGSMSLLKRVYRPRRLPRPRSGRSALILMPVLKPITKLEAALQGPEELGRDQQLIIYTAEPSSRSEQDGWAVPGQSIRPVASATPAARGQMSGSGAVRYASGSKPPCPAGSCIALEARTWTRWPSGGRLPPLAYVAIKRHRWSESSRGDLLRDVTSRLAPRRAASC
jgi:hypothetical protein